MLCSDAPMNHFTFIRTFSISLAMKRWLDIISDSYQVLYFPQQKTSSHWSAFLQVWLTIVYSCHPEFLKPPKSFLRLAFASFSAWKTLPLIVLLCLIKKHFVALSSLLAPQSTCPRLLNTKCGTHILHQLLPHHPIPFSLPRSEILLFVHIRICLFHNSPHQNVRSMKAGVYILSCSLLNLQLLEHSMIGPH